MSITAGLEHLQKALEFEKEGFEFYRDARARTEHPTARSVFDLLMGEEKKHADYLLSLHGTLSAEGKWPEEVTLSMDKDFKMIFREEKEKIDETVNVSTTEQEALRHAVDLEKRGQAMYADLAAKAEDPREKQLFQRLADWERSHAEFAEDYYTYFSDKGLFMDE